MITTVTHFNATNTARPRILSRVQPQGMTHISWLYVMILCYTPSAPAHQLTLLLTLPTHNLSHNWPFIRRGPQYHKNFRVNALPCLGSNWGLCGGSLMPWLLGNIDTTIAAIPPHQKNTLCLRHFPKHCHNFLSLFSIFYFSNPCTDPGQWTEFTPCFLHPLVR